MGLINAIGNLGGYFGPVVIGYFLKRSGGFVYGFGSLGAGLLLGAVLCFCLPPERKAAVLGAHGLNGDSSPATPAGSE
jgi:ACS family tartrate transporter-like MFS transporter